MKNLYIIFLLWLIFFPMSEAFSKIAPTATNRTLSAWVQSINRTTGDVIISGVDTRGPSTPTLTFTWVWGDGTSNNGFFPQTKKYANINRNYVVKIISNYPNNEKDSVEVVIDFTTATNGRTLSAWIQSINRTTGDIIITGVDTRGPSTPTLTFTWVWDDGTSNNGFFPQTKKYANVNRNYVVKIIANYPNNEKDSVEVVVDFTTATTGQTLSAWIQSINRNTGDVIINGVDTRGPSTPTLTFTWVWGDGTSNNGFFPQTKKYADVNRNYVVKIIANYPNNEKDSIVVVVNFTTLNLSGVAISGIQQVEQTLISTQTIPPNTNVTYQAGNSISLQGTFSAQTGSVFTAKIKSGN